jgi:hypothetical protein
MTVYVVSKASCVIPLRGKVTHAELACARRGNLARNAEMLERYSKLQLMLEDMQCFMAGASMAEVSSLTRS